MRLFQSLYLALILAASGLACSLASLPVYLNAEFVESRYIFVGQVVGKTKENTSKHFRGKAYGIKLKPVMAVSLPNKTSEYYELFRYGVTPSCVPRPYFLDFPIGTLVTVVAKESRFLNARNDQNQLRIQTDLTDSWNYSVTVSTKNSWSTASEYDYKKWRKRFLRLEKADHVLRTALRRVAFFETAKDLLRHKNGTEKKKLRVLKRLVYSPTYIDFPGLVDPRLKRSVLDVLAIGGLKPTSKLDQARKLKLSNSKLRLLKTRKNLEDKGYFRVN